MNRQQRGARQVGSSDDFPPGYVEQIKAMAETITRWLAAHPEAKPVFWIPPPEVMVAVDLPSIVDRVARNPEAREIVNLLIESVEYSKAPTLFMLQVALQHTKCLAAVIVPLDVFTEGPVYVGRSKW